jgi:hypothetical protein
MHTLLTNGLRVSIGHAPNTSDTCILKDQFGAG